MEATLDQLALKYGTDKSSKHHNYTHIYERYLKEIRHDAVSILELGYGGHGDKTKGGESAMMWRDYFHKGTISVLDIEDKTNIPNGVNFFVGGQNDINVLNKIYNKHGKFDLIIDDASHLSSLTIGSFEILFGMLSKDGIYVIEDTHSSYHDWYYGTEESNPNPEKNGKKSITTMNYFKRLCDELNKDFIHESYHKGYGIEYIHFYKDIIFIKKGEVIKYKKTTILQDKVIKEYSESCRGLFENELTAYKKIPFACPKLIEVKDLTLVIEKCTPILDIPKDLSYKYIEPLKELLEKINKAGYWHRDIALRNVVVNSKDEVLLIDWESIVQAVSTTSYDLYGMQASGYRDNPSPKGVNGMWWGYDGQFDSPIMYWNND